MKNNMCKFRGFATFLVVMVCSLAVFGQTTESVALKTLTVLGDIPVVYQDEVKGGVHQISGEPWSTIENERIDKGMLATNTTDFTTYRYVGVEPATDASNIADNWERVYLVTAYVAANSYAAEEIVIKDNILYKANATIPASTTFATGSTGATWTPLADQFTVADYQTATKAISSAVVGTYISGGTEIILVNGDYTLPTAASKKGATVTIKNTKAADLLTETNPETSQIEIKTAADTETIDGADYSSNGIKLFRQFDYITLLSDGTQWYKVAGGSKNIAERETAADVTGDNSKASKEHTGAFYLGDPDTDGSWRFTSLEGDEDSNGASVERLRVEYRTGGVWVLKTSIIP